MTSIRRRIGACVAGFVLTAGDPAVASGAVDGAFFAFSPSLKRSLRAGNSLALGASRRSSRSGGEAGGDHGGGGRVTAGGRRRSREDDGDHPSSSRTTKAMTPFETSSELSTFWRAVARVDPPSEDDVVPCVPHLDADGPLPFGAYRTVGREECGVPKSCLVTVALDVRPSKNGGRVLDPASNRPMGQVGGNDGLGGGVEGRADPEEAVRNVRSLIDAGFTSFQIAHSEDDHGRPSSDPDAPGVQEWAERNVYGRLRAEVPPTVLRDCHLTTRVEVPPVAEAVSDTASAQPFGRGTAVRAAIGASLRRIGGECIDAVQVPYVKDSPYHLDVLDTLFDMQREGIIRSIGGLNFPPPLLKSAEECGFHLDTNQVQCNILDPDPYDEALQPCSEAGTKLLVSSPLAGGLLTDRFLQMPDEPHPLYLSANERRHILTTLRVWAERRSCLDGGSEDGGKQAKRNADIFRQFHSNVLGALSDVSRKHQVPVAAVALRLALRLDNLGSVVVSSRVGAAIQSEESGGGLYNRHRKFRQLFSFDLDEEDEERLWDVSGRKQLPTWEEDVSQFLEEEMLLGSSSGDVFVPDLSNRKLWL